MPINFHVEEPCSQQSLVRPALTTRAIDRSRFYRSASANVSAVVLPGASLGLGLPYAPAHKMLRSGLSVAIASDWNPGSAPQGNLLVSAALLGASEKLTNAETLAVLQHGLPKR